MNNDKLYLYGALVFVCFFLVYVFAYVSSTETVTINVTDKERITTGTGETLSSKFLVYTTDEVFENSDDLLFLKFNSADVQNKLDRNSSYTVRVVGWRIQFFSMYRNILDVID